jgi:serine protease
VTRHHDGPAGLAIPDNTTAGVTSDITVTGAGTIRAHAVNVAITHTFIGDLTIRLQRVGGREIVLLREQLIDGTSLSRTFTADGFVGEAAAGTWRLTVVDGAARDTGTLDSWSLDMTSR